MKKSLSFLLALALLFCTAACSAPGSNASPTIEPTPAPDPATQASAFNQFGGSEMYLSAEDTTALQELLAQEGWASGNSFALAEVRFNLPGGETFDYASEDGVFINGDGTLNLTLSDEDRESLNAMLSSYITLGELSAPARANSWGLTFTAENVTSTGMTLVCAQSGGEIKGELMTASSYSLDRLGIDNGWKAVDFLAGDNVTWTSESIAIPAGSTLKLQLDWEALYGSLPAGTYRIGKRVIDYVSDDQFTVMMVYGEFTIE